MQLKLAAVVSAGTTVIKLKEDISRETEFFDKNIQTYKKDAAYLYVTSFFYLITDLLLYIFSAQDSDYPHNSGLSDSLRICFCFLALR